jgi:hypothetical protein
MAAASTGTGELDPLFAALKKLSIHDMRAIEDLDWKDTHQKIMDFRDKEKLTIIGFLKFCGLDSRSYFQQLCCRTGSMSNPSRRKGSSGAAFLMKVKEVLIDKPLPDHLDIEPEDLFEYVYEWFQDNRLKLKEKGITELSLSFKNPKLISVVNRETCELTKEHIFNLMKADPRLKKEIAEDFEMTILTMRPAINTPVALLCNSGAGTGTVLNVRGSPFALTCAHVVGTLSQIGSKISYIPEKDEATSKYSFCADGPFFGNVVFVSSDNDFGLLSPSPNLSLVLNKVDGFPFPLRLEKFWGDDNRNGVAFLSGKKVCKHGISSGLTVGAILVADLGTFFVNALQMTPFSIPGDSGSLVFDIETGVVYGMVTDIQFKQVDGTASYVTGVLPLWRFWDELMDMASSGFWD